MVCAPRDWRSREELMLIPSADWMRLTYVMEGSLSADLHVSFM